MDVKNNDTCVLSNVLVLAFLSHRVTSKSCVFEYFPLAASTTITYMTAWAFYA